MHFEFQFPLLYVQEIGSSLVTARRGSESLANKQSSLTDHVVRADVAVLRQRLTLLDKQCTEMDNQVSLARSYNITQEHLYSSV